MFTVTFSSSPQQMKVRRAEFHEAGVADKNQSASRSSALQKPHLHMSQAAKRLFHLPLGLYNCGLSDQQSCSKLQVVGLRVSGIKKVSALQSKAQVFSNPMIYSSTEVDQVHYSRAET
jgi:hypothetical protein